MLQKEANSCAKIADVIQDLDFKFRTIVQLILDYKGSIKNKRSEIKKYLNKGSKHDSDYISLNNSLAEHAATACKLHSKIDDLKLYIEAHKTQLKRKIEMCRNSNLKILSALSKLRPSSENAISRLLYEISPILDQASYYSK